MITRAEAEDFLYREAALLDAWKLDEWLGLLTEDARYRVPSNDAPDADPANTLFLIADDIQRIRGRVARLKDPNAHAEFPHSRTRRIITNVRIVDGSSPSPLGEGRGEGRGHHRASSSKRGNRRPPSRTLRSPIRSTLSSSRAARASRSKRSRPRSRCWPTATIGSIATMRR